jgi:hypothetical protein
MILSVSEVQPEDVRHLFCSDPQLKNEVARGHRAPRPSVDSTVTQRGGELDKPLTIPQPRPAA